jgi:hypothetical protein
VGLEPTPVQRATESTRTYDSTRLKLGAGLGITLTRPPVPALRFDLYAQEQVLFGRDHADGVESAGSILSMGFQIGAAF